jgi:hypothetical protein
MLIRIEPTSSLFNSPRGLKVMVSGAGACGAGQRQWICGRCAARTGQLAVDNAYRVAHRAGLRPQAPQPATTIKKDLNTRVQVLSGRQLL